MNLPLPHTATQAEILAYLARTTERYLEVGVQEGRSLETVLTNAKHLDEIALCDTWGSVSGGSGRGNHNHITALLSRCEWGGYTTYLDGDSREQLPGFSSVSLPYDLVHIDGGHSEDVAASDLKYGWRLCSHVMVVHDVSMQGVWLSLFAFLQTTPGIHVQLFVGGHGTAVLSRINP